MSGAMPASERERFARLYDAHVDAIFRYVARRLGAESASDVVADIFATALERIDSYDPRRGREIAWLYGIANNHLRRHWRTEQRRLSAWRRASRQPSTGDPLIEATDRLAADDDVSVVMAAIGRLDASERDLLFLIAWEDVSYATCAQALGIPVGTVRSRLHRIRSTLRAALDHETTTETTR